MVVAHQFVYLRTRAQESTLKGHLATLRGALLLYYGDTDGFYPPRLSDLMTERKYLPEIPREDIPAVEEAGNPGHLGVQAQDRVYPKIPQSPADFQDEGTVLWGYIGQRTSLYHGHVFINCQHRDTKSSPWTRW